MCLTNQIVCLAEQHICLTDQNICLAYQNAQTRVAGLHTMKSEGFSLVSEDYLSWKPFLYLVEQVLVVHLGEECVSSKFFVFNYPLLENINQLHLFTVLHVR